MYFWDWAKSKTSDPSMDAPPRSSSERRSRNVKSRPSAQDVELEPSECVLELDGHRIPFVAP